MAAGVTALPVWAQEAVHVPPAQRIVSLNLCVDQVLLDLVPRERIAGLSFLAADPSMSLKHREARGIATVRGAAEEVLALDPDLVLAGEYTTGATVGLLRRLGRRVEVVPMASSFQDIRAFVRRIAGLTDTTASGERLIADFDARLDHARAAASTQSRPRAVAMQVNSLAAGPGSLMDEVLSTAGFENAARSARVSSTGRLPLESLVSSPPDLIVLANAASDFRTVLGDNLRHPAFLALQRDRPTLHIPMAQWLCGTTRIIEAVERLNSMRARVATPVAAKP